jgi:hypothetical protein
MAVEFEPRGWGLQDRKNRPVEILCEMSKATIDELEKAMHASACLGISEALRAHEEVHHTTCLQAGFFPFIERHGVDVAQDEIKAYGVQIEALRALIGRVLEGGGARVEMEATLQTLVPLGVGDPDIPGPDVIQSTSKGEVAFTRSVLADAGIHLEGEGKQLVNATVQGICSLIDGVPFSIPARAKLGIDGDQAAIQYSLPTPGAWATALCHDPGPQKVFPFFIAAGGPARPIQLPLKNGAEHAFKVEDVAAALVPDAGIRITGEGKMRLRFCEAPSK